MQAMLVIEVDRVIEFVQVIKRDIKCNINETRCAAYTVICVAHSKTALSYINAMEH
jgi:hypothetical protein